MFWIIGTLFMKKGGFYGHTKYKTKCVFFSFTNHLVNLDC